MESFSLSVLPFPALSFSCSVSGVALSVSAALEVGSSVSALPGNMSLVDGVSLTVSDIVPLDASILLVYPEPEDPEEPPGAVYVDEILSGLSSGFYVISPAAASVVNPVYKSIDLSALSFESLSGFVINEAAPVHGWLRFLFLTIPGFLDDPDLSIKTDLIVPVARSVLTGCLPAGDFVFDFFVRVALPSFESVPLEMGPLSSYPVSVGSVLAESRVLDAGLLPVGLDNFTVSAAVTVAAPSFRLVGLPDYGFPAVVIQEVVIFPSYFKALDLPAPGLVPADVSVAFSILAPSIVSKNLDPLFSFPGLQLVGSAVLPGESDILNSLEVSQPALKVPGLLYAAPAFVGDISFQVSMPGDPVIFDSSVVPFVLADGSLIGPAAGEYVFSFDLTVAGPVFAALSLAVPPIEDVGFNVAWLKSEPIFLSLLGLFDPSLPDLLPAALVGPAGSAVSLDLALGVLSGYAFSVGDFLQPGSSRNILLQDEGLYFYQLLSALSAVFKAGIQSVAVTFDGTVY